MKIHVLLLYCKKKRKKKRKKKKKRFDSPVVGIDLGTTFSCISLYREETKQTEIIPNMEGSRTTASVVAWDENGDILIGQAAKNHASKDPQNTFYDVKRFIGRDYKEVLKIDKELVSYKLLNKNKRLLLQRNKSNEFISYTPEQISSYVLSYLKESAEQYLGEPIRHAVITVPAYFNDRQRTATVNAGKIAGLNVVRIINEPTAASMAYGLEKKKEHNILVFDLGGGTFDVSLLTIDNGFFEVIATSGDMHLGGEDFDMRLVNHLSEVWKRKHPELMDFMDDQQAFQRVKQACEKAKISLSSELETDLYVDNLIGEIDLHETITRAKFEQLNMDLFKKVLKPVKEVLDDSGMRHRDIQEIVLVGGSTRIPKVQKMISQYFNNHPLSKEVNPDEAVAFGAAIQAAIIAGKIQKLIVDVTPMSLGIETVGQQMSIIIPKQTQLPAEKSEVYTTSHTNQEMIKIPIFEGEGRIVTRNRKLGEFELRGIPPAPKGIPKIKITFQLDQNNILKVTAIEQKTGAKVEGVIEKGDLSAEEVEEFRKLGEDGRKEDDNQLKKNKLKARFLEFFEVVKEKSKTKEILKKYSKKNRGLINKNIKKVENWLDRYSRVSKYEVMKEQYVKFRDFICPILDIEDYLWDVEDIEREFSNEEKVYNPDDEPVFEEITIDDDDNNESQKQQKQQQDSEEIKIDEEEEEQQQEEIVKEIKVTEEITLDDEL